MIRPARASDIPAILEIWNPIIRNTAVTFSSEERTADGLAQTIADRRARGREFLVAEDAGRLAGFASYDQFRGGNGYVHAMEHTVILGPAARGRGFGRGLMAAVEDHARAAGHHTTPAWFSPETPACIVW